MGKLLRVINQRYTFYISVKSIYFKTNGELLQQFKIMTRDGTELTRQCHLELIDAIYRGKIKDTAGLNEHVLSKYRIDGTSKKL